MRKQRYSLGWDTREKLGLQRRYMFRNKKSAVEGEPMKVGVGLKRRRELNKRGGAGDKLGGGDPLRRRRPHICSDQCYNQYSDQCFNRNRAPCVASTAVGTKGEKEQTARSSA